MNHADFSNRINWLCERMNELLPIAYYHTVFSSPHNLNDLILCNKEALYPIIFVLHLRRFMILDFPNGFRQGTKNIPELNLVLSVFFTPGVRAFRFIPTSIISSAEEVFPVMAKDGLIFPARIVFNFPLKPCLKYLRESLYII